MAGTPEEPGIMFLIIKGMFDSIQTVQDKKFEIKVTFVEIYNEVIRDLLVSNSKDTYLDLRDDPDKGIQLSGVTEFQVHLFAIISFRNLLDIFHRISMNNWQLMNYFWQLLALHDMNPISHLLVSRYLYLLFD